MLALEFEARFLAIKSSHHLESRPIFEARSRNRTVLVWLRDVPVPMQALRQLLIELTFTSVGSVGSVGLDKLTKI